MQAKGIEKQIERIQRDLMALGPMRPGSLSPQYTACEKLGCACVDPLHPKKHGPFYQLSYSHAGKSTTRFIRPGYVTQIKKIGRLQAIPSAYPEVGRSGHHALTASLGGSSPGKRPGKVAEKSVLLGYPVKRSK